jgi:hypothetical protein
MELLGALSGDLAAYGDSDMNESKLQEIAERLGRLDAGQLHVISRLDEFKKNATKMEDKLEEAIYGTGRHTGILTRVDLLERQLHDQQQRMQPWRQMLFTIGASVLAACLTYVVLHHVV